MALKPILIDTEDNKLKCGETVTDAKLDRINARLNLACCLFELGDDAQALGHINAVNSYLGLPSAAQGTYSAVKEIYTCLYNSGALVL
ncbi:MAG: hypothetical protein J6S84_08885 [Bacteroidales bacterium]|nr:hypothetical protein [Bacteroidales bacterium]